MKNNKNSMMSSEAAVIATINNSPANVKRQWIINNVRKIDPEKETGKCTLIKDFVVKYRVNNTLVHISDRLLSQCEIIKQVKGKNVYLRCPFEINGTKVRESALLVIGQVRGVLVGVLVDYDLVPILSKYSFRLKNRGTVKKIKRIDVEAQVNKDSLSIEEIVWCTVNNMPVRKLTSTDVNMHHHGYLADKRCANISLLSKEEHDAIHNEISQSSHEVYMHIGFDTPIPNETLRVYDIIPELIIKKAKKCQ